MTKWMLFWLSQIPISIMQALYIKQSVYKSCLAKASWRAYYDSATAVLSDWLVMMKTLYFSHKEKNKVGGGIAILMLF